MPRKSRREEGGGTYHVFARGNRREPIFCDAGDRSQYLLTLGLVVEELEWRVLAYCLMENHVHLLIETTLPNRAAGMQVLHGTYARYFNDMYAKTGHLFQRPYGFSRSRNNGTTMYFACYVLLNPVRAGLCQLPEQYRWSSYRATIGHADPPPWLDVTRLLGYFGEREADAVKRFTTVVSAVGDMGAAGFEPATSRV